MSGAESDRNLLFGIVCLQMEFVTQDELVKAMALWVVRKSTKLGAILVELGALSEDRRKIMDVLVDEHIRQHRGDPRISLAALSGSDAHRAAAAIREQAPDDPDLSLSLAALKSRADDWVTREPGPLRAADDAPRFRVLRPHAKGGLGQVYLARDVELGRSVALKEIQDRFLSSAELRARFVLEAEINGNLEHPGIVPVYGLGAYRDGRPYYAMRFIQGATLNDSIKRFHSHSQQTSHIAPGEDQLLPPTAPDHPVTVSEETPAGSDPIRSDQPRELAFRQLLRRFVDVCNAISYAHSRGVLHRDLKPANIMLGEFGETLVVDWGLAKATGRADLSQSLEHASQEPVIPPSGDGSEATVAGAPIGTPQFASPEQVEGRLDLLGPTTDVYGLGAILYNILTGRPPITGSNLEVIIARVISGEIRAPRLLLPRAGIHPALEAICMTALARDPRERYKTVRALADDVECFLADEPVSCYRDPVFERVRRWSRKRRTLVTSMAGVLLAVAVASGVAWVRESSLNRRLVKLNQDLKLEERKSHERELLAIDSVKKFRDVVSKNRILRSRADLKDLRDTLLREPLAFFEKLRLQLESAPNPSAANQGRLADALYELARSTWNLSRLSDSEVSMARCVQIRQRLAANTVASRRQQFTLAEALHDHAEILHDLGRYNEAQSRFESAVRVLEPLHESDPSDTEAIDLLAWHTSGLAFFWTRRDQHRRAIEYFQRAQALQEALVALNPSDSEYLATLSTISNDLAISLFHTGDKTNSSRSFRRALDLDRQISQSAPTPDNRIGVAISLSNLANVLMRSGQNEEPISLLAESIVLYESAIAEHPELHDWQYRLALALHNLATLHNENRELKQAISYASRASRILSGLVTEYTDVVPYRLRLAEAKNLLGLTLISSGRPEEGAEVLHSALSIAKQLLANDPENLDLKRSLAAMLTNLSYAQLKQGRPLLAAQSIRDAYFYWKDPIQANPENPFYLDSIKSWLRVR